MMDSPMMAMDKEMKKKKEAMKKRLASLGMDNPVVKSAMKSQDPMQHDKKWQEWNVVDELVSAARRKYFDGEGESMGKCVGNLADALSKLASKAHIDKGMSKMNNRSSDEDY